MKDSSMNLGLDQMSYSKLLSPHFGHPMGKMYQLQERLRKLAFYLIICQLDLHFKIERSDRLK
jgi:hypothetical protein